MTNPEKLQPIPHESAPAKIEDEKTISLARQAEEAFTRNDFDTVLDKLRELQRITSPKIPESKRQVRIRRSGPSFWDQNLRVSSS